MLMRPHRSALASWVALGVWLTASVASAQAGSVSGTVRDETGGVLPGVSVELRGAGGLAAMAVSGDRGDYRFEQVAPGKYQISFMLVNFATARRELTAEAAWAVHIDTVLHLALSADVT